jgi:hypothetical protein
LIVQHLNRRLDDLPNAYTAAPTVEIIRLPSYWIFLYVFSNFEFHKSVRVLGSFNTRSQGAGHEWRALLANRATIHASRAI